MTQDRTAWFTHDRFGMFVHFGLYAVPARHEWVANYEEIPHEVYKRYADVFNPDLFDAASLVHDAKAAGARYLVFTAKHHEGFCLFDTKTTDYNSVRTLGRDLLAEVIAAARAADIRVGVYFSLLDWSHPDYTIDRHHPLRNASDIAGRNATRDMSVYRAYLREQVRELLTAYGELDYLFFDFTEPGVDGATGLPGKGPEDWDAESLLALCRELQPNMIVNDRLGIAADLVTPEQYQPTRPFEVDGEPVVWEACQTINGSWGYHRDNFDDKPVELLVRMLAGAVAVGGNMLLNVGPNARGEITPRDRESLQAIGEWLRLHGDAIYAAGPSTFTPPNGALYTQRGNKLYVHVTTWPFGMLHLPDLAGKVAFARLLNDGSEVISTEIPADQVAFNLVPASPAPGTLTLTLPTRRPDVALPIIELTLRA